MELTLTLLSTNLGSTAKLVFLFGVLLLVLLFFVVVVLFFENIC